MSTADDQYYLQDSRSYVGNRHDVVVRHRRLYL